MEVRAGEGAGVSAQLTPVEKGDWRVGTEVSMAEKGCV